jgi:hypothetical protein
MYGPFVYLLAPCKKVYFHLAPGKKISQIRHFVMVFSLEHPLKLWCQPSLNQVKDSCFQILGFAIWPKKYKVENTEAVVQLLHNPAW